MKNISVKELKLKLDQGEKWQLIDVREPYEVEICSIESLKIPMGEIPHKVDEVSKDIPVAIFCKSGNRSKAVVNFLETEYNYTNLYSLDGGIIAWANEVDDSLEIY